MCIFPAKDVKLLAIIWGSINPSETFPLDFVLNTSCRLHLAVLLTEGALALSVVRVRVAYQLTLYSQLSPVPLRARSCRDPQKRLEEKA